MMNVLVIDVGLKAKSYAFYADEFRAVKSALIARREQQVGDKQCACSKYYHLFFIIIVINYAGNEIEQMFSKLFV